MNKAKSQVTSRFQMVDALRGAAIVMMFVFHFTYDLNDFRFINVDFYHNPFWLNFRTVIVTTFLSVMGISLYLAHHKGIQRRRYLQRLSWLLICALLITIATRYWAGTRFIYFGILHFIAAASILALPFVRLYWTNLLLGIAIIISGNLVSLEFMNPRYLNWIGLMQGKPLTDDYVPLFPWLGVVLLGIFFARWAYTSQHFVPLSQWQSRSPLIGGIRFAGRHSLLIYMVHQPVFIGSLYLTRLLFPH